MLVFTIILLWLLVGFIYFRIKENSWRAYHYERFSEHYNPTSEDLKFGIIFTLCGVFTLILGVLNDNRILNLRIRRGLIMVFYNKEKVEKYFKDREDITDKDLMS